MKINSFCLTCLINMQEAQVRKFDDEEKKMTYMREVLAFLSSCDPDLSAPALVKPLSRIYEKYWGKRDSMDEVKQEFNDYLLSMEEELEAQIRNHPDSLEAALCYARTGNYIDYAAVKDITKEHASSLVWLTDNCGEIVLDKIAMKILQEQHPGVKVTAIVRGEPVVNDADLEAARYVGLDRIVNVTGNGSGIAGTDLADISEEAERLIRDADLIVSKGQGNFETIHGCGLNIYYLFLCKCDWFVQKFQAERFQGMFINERSIS